MIDYPSLPFALLQGLLTAALILGPPLVLAFGGRLRKNGTDWLLIAAALAALALLTLAVFLPFEGLLYGPLLGWRPILLGALALILGMVATQWKSLVRRPLMETLPRLGAGLLAGALWGGVWRIAGIALLSIGVANNG